MAIRILGTGSYLAEKEVSNDELAKYVDTSDEWISSRTGIKNRRIAVKETTTSMAAEAAERALEMAGKSAENVELIVLATVTPDYYTPSGACQVQAAIGADKAIAFDVNAACSGFVFALNVAKMYIETGFVKNALVIGSETLSKILDWNDRGTCVLFGDGAGAAYIEESDKGIISIVQGSIGKKGMVLNCESRKTNNIFVKDEINHDYLYMDGQEVYKFAVRQCPKCLQEALDKAGMTVDDVDYFVLHQANVRIIESVAKRLKAPLEKFPTTLECTCTSRPAREGARPEARRQDRHVGIRRRAHIRRCGYGVVEALTPVIFEGGTELLVVWEYFFYLGPEKCGVVHLLSVTQLVDYHVVYDFGSGVHQCTVEIQVTGGAAASPAGLLMPDGDPSVGHAYYLSKMFYT